MEKPYRYKKKLVKIGNARYISIPADWLKKQAEKMKVRVIKFLDLFIYDKYIDIKPSKK